MKKDSIKIIISLILFLTSLLIDFKFTLINQILFITSYLIVGTEILIKAIINIFKGKVLDENFLMSIATIGAILIGELSEAVTVMLFYKIGEFLEDLAVDKSKKSISDLMDIRPDYANLYQNGHEKKVNPNKVKIGDNIVIKPGEKIPLDGIITEGTTSLDMKALTGEAIPIDVQMNDKVYSGCINLNGLIKVKVTKEFEQSTVSKILNLVENASDRKTKSESFVTKFAKYYTPVVVIIAFVIGLIVPLLVKDNFSPWIYRALAFLVVSCPCALVISVPLSFFAGLGGASKMGILVKGSNYLETLSKVDTIIFDKTGTLTKGTFTIQKIETNNIKENELIKYAALAEYHSSHPIAVTIKNAYKGKIDETKIKKIKEFSGSGVKAQVSNNIVLVGNNKLMTENNIEVPTINDTGTILYVAINNKYKGYILIADEIKDDAKKTIEILKQNGVKKTIILTGDSEKNGKTVAKAVNIDEVYASLLPQDKVAKLEEILATKSDNSRVAFVGDGINDAPVLALADVGIAMGALGSDSAIEAADIVIMTDELNKITKAITLSRKTMRIVKENIIFAILVKVIVLFLIALGFSSMWQAIFADVGVSTIAIINSLRTLRVNKKLQIR